MTKGKTIALVVGVVVASGVVMIASCAGIIYLGYSAADSKASPYVDQMFAAIENGTFGQTYDTLASKELQAAVTHEEYEKMGESIAERLGSLKSKSLTSFNMQTNNMGSFIDVSYSAEFAKGDGTIDAKLIKEQGDWKFLGFHVNSPLFEKDTDK